MDASVSALGMVAVVGVVGVVAVDIAAMFFGKSLRIDATRNGIKVDASNSLNDEIDSSHKDV